MPTPHQPTTPIRQSDETPKGARIKVVGVGGGGSNAIDRMIDFGVEGVEFIAFNTDIQALEVSKAPVRLQIGARLTNGLSAGSDPDVGRRAAIQDADLIVEALEGADMVFVTTGLGGGTGTGAAPVIAAIASEMGALTVAIVTRPFGFEGKRRMAIADWGIHHLLNYVDTLIVIPNEKLLALAKDAPFFESFRIADDFLRDAVQGISDIITSSGVINRDFADVRTTMAGMGYAVMGTASRSGPNRAVDAVMAAMASPLLEAGAIDGARGILINVTGSSSLKLGEVNAASTVIQGIAHEDANIIFGAVLDERLGDEVKVTVIATGFLTDGRDRSARRARLLRGNTAESPVEASAVAPSSESSAPEPEAEPEAVVEEPLQAAAEEPLPAEEPQLAPEEIPPAHEEVVLPVVGAVIPVVEPVLPEIDLLPLAAEEALPFALEELAPGVEERSEPTPGPIAADAIPDELPTQQVVASEVDPHEPVVAHETVEQAAISPETPDIEEPNQEEPHQEESHLEEPQREDHHVEERHVEALPIEELDEVPEEDWLGAIRELALLADAEFGAEPSGDETTEEVKPAATSVVLASGHKQESTRWNDDDLDAEEGARYVSSSKVPANSAAPEFVPPPQVEPVESKPGPRHAVLAAYAAVSDTPEPVAAADAAARRSSAFAEVLEARRRFVEKLGQQSPVQDTTTHPTESHIDAAAAPSRLIDHARKPEPIDDFDVEDQDDRVVLSPAHATKTLPQSVEAATPVVPPPVLSVQENARNLANSPLFRAIASGTVPPAETAKEDDLPKPVPVFNRRLFRRDRLSDTAKALETESEVEARVPVFATDAAEEQDTEKRDELEIPAFLRRGHSTSI